MFVKNQTTENNIQNLEYQNREYPSGYFRTFMCYKIHLATSFAIQSVKARGLLFSRSLQLETLSADRDKVNILDITNLL